MKKYEVPEINISLFEKEVVTEGNAASAAAAAVTAGALGTVATNNITQTTWDQFNITF